MNAPTSSAEIQSLQAKQTILVNALRPFVAEDAPLWQPEDIIPYECDSLAAYRKMPLAVALPENEEQVVNILKTCKTLGGSCGTPRLGPLVSRAAQCRLSRAWFYR